MRLLVLYQARNSAEDQPGYYCGFDRMVREGKLDCHLALPYMSISENKGWESLWDRAYSLAKENWADIVFLQYFHAKMPDPSTFIQRIKSLPSKPLVISSLGDPFGRYTRRVPETYAKVTAHSDLNFLTGMGYIAKQLARQGGKNLVLMPNGCCQVRFSEELEVVPRSEPEFYVSFVGSRIRSLDPFSHFFWTSRRREAFVAAFSKRYGTRFGLFGKGWNGNLSWQGPVPYREQQKAYRRSAVAVGGTPNGNHDYYTSDRVFIAAASATPLVDYWVPGVDRILVNGRDWWLGRDTNEMIRLCDELLNRSTEERIELGRNARLRILERHTQYHRCVEMMEIANEMRAARTRGRVAPQPALPFLMQTNANDSLPKPVVAWIG